MNNPLLNFDSLPRFTEINAEHAVPALEHVLNRNRQAIDQLASLANPDWGNFANEMENLDERLGRVWSPIGHLNSVMDSPELREAYQTGIGLLTEYSSELGQHAGLQRQYQSIAAADSFSALSDAQKKVVSNALLDFKRSGVELPESERDRLTDINQQLSDICNQFERNVLDATQSWSCLITDEFEVSGLPDTALAVARQAADETGQKGWLFNLQFPSYLAVMQHADNPALREQMYRAYVTRASKLSESPEFDNSGLIDNILALRKEKAELLGYQHYAAYSLEKKMAESEEHVQEFLLELLEHAKPVAEKEVEELKDFAIKEHQCEELQPWDISYYSEKLREQRYQFNAEQIKPYLPANKALQGMFEIVGRLFNIDICENSEMPSWHSDVRSFDVIDRQSKTTLGSLYTDLYVRKNKRGGAWMNTCIDRRRLEGDIQNPVAFLTCNFSPPVGQQAALLSHQELETLFHEFGHTLHHLLTKVDEMAVAGINGVAWDAVELPSQFLENWCWQEESLNMIAEHHETGEALPSDLLQRMNDAKNFQAGMQAVRQIEFALFDMRLHSQKPGDTRAGVQHILDQVRQQVAVLEAPDYNRFQNSFGHIFAGGYAAGYYSYKWAEVLSADAFEKFEEEGLFNSQTGQHFKQSILQRGGVDDPNDLFIEFRGRPPSTEALLRHTGILT